MALILIENKPSPMSDYIGDARRIIDYARDLDGEGMTDSEVIEYLRWIASYLEASVNARRCKH